MIILNTNDFHDDECELMFDHEKLPLNDAMHAFCQTIEDNPSYIGEKGYAVINIMYKRRSADRHPFGLRYHTTYEEDHSPTIEFEFIDRDEKDGPSLIPDNIFDMQTVYLKKTRFQNNEKQYVLTIVVNSSEVHKSINQIQK